MGVLHLPATLNRRAFAFLVLLVSVPVLFFTSAQDRDRADGAALNNDSLSTCTTINCGSQILNVSVLEATPGALPFSTQVAAGAGECLRIDAVSQSQDWELVVVAPDGSVWRNDDTDGLLPEIRALTPTAGWYTVHLAHWVGSDVDGTARLQYGRYNSDNPNCTSPTAAFAEAAADAK